MALTAQPRAKLVKAITSFPSVAKGTAKKRVLRKVRYTGGNLSAFTAQSILVQAHRREWKHTSVSGRGEHLCEVLSGGRRTAQVPRGTSPVKGGASLVQ